MAEKKNKNYFTHDTELAIIKYVNTENYAERNKIYREEIHYALFKLTQRQKTLYFPVVLVFLKLNLLNSLFLIVIEFNVFDQLRRLELHKFVLLV